MATIGEMRAAIVEAVGALDLADGSRSAAIEAMDFARDTLAEAYGPGFDKALEHHLETIEDHDSDGIADEFDEDLESGDEE